MQPLLARVILAIALMTGSANAQGFATIGAGTDSCGSWTALRRQSEFAAVQPAEWILGFLSGVGFRGVPGRDDPLNNVDARAVWAWVDNYCLAHPLENIEQAGAAFFDAHPN